MNWRHSAVRCIQDRRKILAPQVFIRLGDATLLPGFIDAHVHLSAESSDNWYEDWFDGMMRFPAERALYGAHCAKVTLEAEVTTDPVDNPQLTQEEMNAIVSEAHNWGRGE